MSNKLICGEIELCLKPWILGMQAASRNEFICRTFDPDSDRYQVWKFSGVWNLWGSDGISKLGISEFSLETSAPGSAILTGCSRAYKKRPKGFLGRIFHLTKCETSFFLEDQPQAQVRLQWSTQIDEVEASGRRLKPVYKGSAASPNFICENLKVNRTFKRTTGKKGTFEFSPENSLFSVSQAVCIAFFAWRIEEEHID